MSLQIPPSLRHRKFLYLWLGLIISVSGSQMQVAAIQWHIRTLTGTPDPLALGAIGLARIGPVVVFSLIAGAVADTFDRRLILFVTQSSMTILAAILAWLTFTNQVTIWHIYVLTAIQAAAQAFDLPARQAMTPNLVPERDLPNAFSLSSIAFNVGAILGPVLSGVVIATLGQGYTYLFNAVSFLAVILALFAIGTVPQDKRNVSGIKLQAIKEGIEFILSKPIILSSMLLDFFATFFASANTMMPIVARDILKVGEVGYGWLVSAQSIGSVTAAAIVSQARDIRRQGTLLVGAVLVFGASTILFGFSTSFGLAMIMLIVMGAGDAVSTIIRNTIRQLQTPDAMRGRMTSVNQIFFQGGPQFGEVEAGVVAQLFGVPLAIISGGLGTILAVALIVLKWPQLRRYNGDEAILAGSPAD